MGLGLSLGFLYSLPLSDTIFISSLTTEFKARVASDGGVFEAESCLNTILTNLNNM